MPTERKIEIEARLHCDTCQGDPYWIWRRQVAPESPVWENVVQPAPGTTLPPMADPERPTCPGCKKDLRRVSAA